MWEFCIFFISMTIIMIYYGFYFINGNRYFIFNGYSSMYALIMSINVINLRNAVVMPVSLHSEYTKRNQHVAIILEYRVNNRNYNSYI